MKKSRFIKSFILISIVVLCSTPTAVLAFEGFPYKNGETIELVVPFSPGGGFDVYARLLAPPLEKALEKIGGVNLKVIVVNLPGSGGRLAHEKVYNSEADGRTLILAHSGALPYHEVIYNAKLQTGEFTYICALATFHNALAVRKDLGIKNFHELIKRSQKQPILMASAGIGDDPHISPVLISALLKEEGLIWNMDFVQFEGTAPARASIPRKETEAMYTVVGSLFPIVDSGDAEFIVTFTRKRDARIPNVPTIFEEKIPRANEMLNATSAMWAVAGPPKMPEVTTDVLKVAALMATHSQEYIDKAKKAKRIVDYLPGNEAQKFAAGKVEVIKKYKQIVEKEIGLR